MALDLFTNSPETDDKADWHDVEFVKTPGGPKVARLKQGVSASEALDHQAVTQFLQALALVRACGLGTPQRKARHALKQLVEACGRLECQMPEVASNIKAGRPPAAAPRVGAGGGFVTPRI